jgi:1,4-dihydroxy-2-naphthoate octaprenyltransferase
MGPIGTAGDSWRRTFDFPWAVCAIIAIVVLAAGIWYDLGAKGTVFSWVPFAIFIPSLPLWGFAGANKFEPMLLLAYPLGAPISLALNVSNTLPDIDEDLAGGVRGLAHQLGTLRALWVTWSAFAAAIAGLALELARVKRLNSPKAICA